MMMSTPFSYLNSFLSLSSHRLAEGFQGLTALQFYILSSIFFVVSLLCRMFSWSHRLAILYILSLSRGLTALQRPAACLRQPSGHAPFAAHILAGIIITIIMIIVIIINKNTFDGNNSDPYFSCAHQVAYKYLSVIYFCRFQ